MYVRQPTLFCDNIGATYLSANHVFHSKMKHLVMDYHFGHQRVQSGELKICYVSTKYQLVDGFTKPLARQRFHDLRTKTGVNKSDIVLKGCIKDKKQQLNSSHVPAVVPAKY